MICPTDTDFIAGNEFLDVYIIWMRLFTPTFGPLDFYTESYIQYRAELGIWFTPNCMQIRIFLYPFLKLFAYLHIPTPHFGLCPNFVYFLRFIIAFFNFIAKSKILLFLIANITLIQIYFIFIIIVILSSELYICSHTVNWSEVVKSKKIYQMKDAGPWAEFVYGGKFAGATMWNIKICREKNSNFYRIRQQKLFEGGMGSDGYRIRSFGGFY